MYRAIPINTATATPPATAPPMTALLIPELELDEPEFELSPRHVTESEGVVVSAIVYGSSVRRSNLKSPPHGEYG
tara:strand:- start:81 stop:305 length:225 start_codon:yes stop_codon:yes gene_type:complete